MEIVRLPDAELYIMKIIWQQGGDVTSHQIMEKLKGEKTWALTTVLNFLIRLTNKGFVSVTKQGKQNIYTPQVAESDYAKLESQSFLKRLHNNSFPSLVACLYDGNAISQSDLAELQAFINEKAGDGK